MIDRDLKKRLLENVTFINAVRLWLICMLLFIPFVTKIYRFIMPWSRELASLINRFDELTIVIFTPIAILKTYRDYKKNEKPELLHFILFFPILLLCISGIISGMLNGNSLLITALGTFAYIKFFFVIFIYSAFFREYNKFKKIFRLLVVIAVFIGLFAFIEEIGAVFYRYVLERDIIIGSANISSGIMSKLSFYSYYDGWRFGIYRASSLLSHYNLLGLYSLLILTIYLHINKKLGIIHVFSLITGILLSVSRTAYSGLALLSVIQIFKGRKWLIVLLIPVAVMLFFMLSYGDSIDMSQLISNENRTINQENIPYREYARQKAMKVWKDHPVWGVGHGMFGGAVAMKYNSPVYEEYNFTLIKLNKSLDQLWPQVLAETGIIGVVALNGLFISMFALFIFLRQQITSEEIRGLFSGLSTFTIIFLVYTLSGNLNNVSVLFPYCAFAGIAFGCNKKIKCIS